MVKEVCCSGAAWRYSPGCCPIACEEVDTGGGGGEDPLIRDVRTCRDLHLITQSITQPPPSVLIWSQSPSNPCAPTKSGKCSHKKGWKSNHSLFCTKTLRNGGSLLRIPISRKKNLRTADNRPRPTQIPVNQPPHTIWAAWGCIMLGYMPIPMGMAPDMGCGCSPGWGQASAPIRQATSLQGKLWSRFLP